MKIINHQSEKFLFNYLTNASPTGFEKPGQEMWINYIKPYVDEWHSDTYGTVYGVINPDSHYKVVIEAHADEISWFIHYITEEGFLKVIRNGGSDHQIAPSKRVNIHTEKGIIKGIFGWPAIHTRKGAKSKLTPTLENIFIDVGAKDKKEVLEMGITIGTVVTFDDEPAKLNSHYYIGRALDNRLGGFCIAEVARLLHVNKKKLPFSLYIVNSVQEEIGLRGAQMIADNLKPNVAIITDVTHDTSTPLVDAKVHGDVKCGEGPALMFAPSVHNKLLKFIMEVADKAKIPYQREAASRATGTDTESFAYSNGGVPSSLISLPLRYMHTTVEMAHKKDIEDVIHLMYKTILALEYGQQFKYL
jgi:putative aminopeptidase FrvX